MPNLPGADLEHQIAIVGNLDVVRAREPESDLTRVSARRDYKVVLELLLAAAVEHQVNAGINVLIFYLAAGWNIGPPLRRVVAFEVVHFASKRRETHYSRLRIRANQA